MPLQFVRKYVIISLRVPVIRLRKVVPVSLLYAGLSWSQHDGLPFSVFIIAYFNLFVNSFMEIFL